MKLSSVKGERTLEVIAELIDPVCNIAEDEAASALFKRERVPDGMTAKAFVTLRVRRSLPSLLKTHKKDIITILSVISDVSYEDYAASLSLPKLFADVAELLTDDVFTDLFISAQTEQISGSAPEITEDV